MAEIKQELDKAMVVIQKLNNQNKQMFERLEGQTRSQQIKPLGRLEPLPTTPLN